jgi:hypothetical protein
MRKAQVEIIVILGVVFLFVVIVFYAYSSGLIGRPSLPEDVAKIQDDVEDRIGSVIAGGSKQLLLDMETHGGYLTDPVFIGGADTTVPDFVLFMGEGVPYWQKCQNDLSPSREDIRRTFEFSLRNYILNHTEEFLDFFGKNVSFDLSGLDVSANILRDKIVITVILPTTVQGYDIRDPYTREVSTKFGGIIDFAADTAKEFSVNRELEYFTIYSIYFSKNLDDGHPKLPTIGFLTYCGEVLYRSTDQIERYLLESATYVVTNTFWWRGLSTNPSQSKTFGIEDVDGKKYMDLNVNMYLPDDFGFTVRGPPIMITNNDQLGNMMIFQLMQCMSAYNNGYEFSYPVVLSVDDPLTGNSFNFASLVYVNEKIDKGSGVESNKRMMPGECDAGVNLTDSVDVCEESGCSAKIRVVWYKDSDGSVEPLEGSTVMFGECNLGETDSSGYASGSVECGTRSLTIFHDSDFSFYNEMITYPELGGTYNLRYKPKMDVHYRKVDVEYDYKSGGEWMKGGSSPCLGSGQRYRCSVNEFGDNEIVMGNMDSVSGGYSLYNRPSDTDAECVDSPECQECLSTSNETVCSVCSDLCKTSGFENDVHVEYIPSGEYSVEMNVRDIDGGYETGEIDLDYRLLDTAEELYVYVPGIWKDVYEIGDYDGECLEDIVANRCGIDLISENEQPTYAYYYGCDNEGLEDVAEDLATKGCGADFAGVLYDVDAFKSVMEGCDARLVCV